MSDTPEDDRALLDKQDLTLDPDGLLDVPEQVEKSECADLDQKERLNGAVDRPQTPEA